MEYKASQGQQGDPALNKANTRLPTLTKIKSKTGTLLIHVQVRRLVWPTALTVLEGVGGRFGLVAHPTLNTKMEGRMSRVILSSTACIGFRDRQPTRVIVPFHGVGCVKCLRCSHLSDVL